ncbi:MAG TPA: M48 family metallopeptidase [Candidatus Sulfotelmatobacter sp.]|nr:M48 family metallopeptidase [Candidatus Sulfotelmatobacter sp.]
MYSQIARNKRRSVVVIVLFLLVWAGVGALLGLLFGSSKNAYQTGGPTLAAILGGMAVAAALAMLAVLWSLVSGRNLVLAASGAHPADPQQYMALHNIVEAVAIGAGLPKPQVYVIDDPSPNAFATGTSPNNAAITATTGLLQMMNREELEGVISHEMSHIKNYDVRLILIVSTLVGLAGLIASLIWRSTFYGRRDRDSDQTMIIVLGAAVLFTIIAVIVGPLIQLALSRSRESLADVSGVELTRNPVGLIGALRKLAANDKPFANFNHATAAMCIDDPLQHHERWYHHLFDTHPPLSERIAVLERIARGELV